MHLHKRIGLFQACDRYNRRRKQASSILTGKGWLDFLPMWDWVGGRTSETAAVGLLPAALQGIDIDHLLAGAKQMDDLTRNSDFTKNPAAMLALSWHYLTDGKGQKIYCHPALQGQARIICQVSPAVNHGIPGQGKGFGG